MDCSQQAPLSMGFSRQEYWSGLPFPFQGIFPTQGSNLGLLHCRQILKRLCNQGSQFYICMYTHTHTHRYIYASYQIIFLYRLLQNVEYTFLCCKVGSCWLSIWYIVAFMHWRRKWQPAPVFLPGESQGRWSLMGCCLWGHTESGTIEAT